MKNLNFKYYQGNYTRKDLLEIKKLLASDPLDPDLVEMMKYQWNLCDDSSIGDKKKFKEILDKVHDAINKKSSRTSPMKGLLINLSKAAAILAIPIVVTLFFLLRHDVVRDKPVAMNTVTTLRGSMKQIVLPDGTKVCLNAHSKLSYPSHFSGKRRVVDLEGQAYFEVTKNPERPFLVKGKDISVTVLGTKFDFRSYKEDAVVSVTLKEGSVLVSQSGSGNSKLCMLKPNEQALWDKEHQKVVVNKVDAKHAGEWMNGYLFFDNMELSQIALSLARNYVVQIKFDEEYIKHLKFYGRFNKNQSLGEILNVVVSGQSFGYQYENNVVVFRRIN